MNEHRYTYEQLHSNLLEQMLTQNRITSKTLLTGLREPFLRLDGQWRYTIDPYDTGIRAQWFLEKGGEFEKEGPVDYSFEKGDIIELPSNWNTVNEKLELYEGGLWYFKELGNIPVSEGEKVVLHIGAANYFSMVFVNNIHVGTHEGGFTPFSVDITDALSDNNRILIWVNNRRRMDAVPSEFTDWFNYGGIYRTVELYKLPSVYIADYALFLSPEKDCYNRIIFEVQLNKPVIRDVCLNIYGLTEISIRTDKTGAGTAVLDVNPWLWSPESPNLYRISISCDNDIVNDEIGFRKIEAAGNKLYLNGKELFLKGVAVHEESVSNGRALTDDDRLEVLNRAREMNCNFLRLAHYPHSEKMARLADRLGILLWEELPVYWSLDFASSGVLDNASNQIRELVKRDRNRASVIIWSVGNENPDTDDRFTFMKYLINDIRSMDTTRLVTAACLIDLNSAEITDRLIDLLDIVSINEYYGWYYSDYSKLRKLLEVKFDKPLVVSEFGAAAYAGKHGGDNEHWTEEKQEKVYREQFEILMNSESVAGVIPWILYDFKTPRRLNDVQKMYNLKGLLDRTLEHRKMAFYFIKSVYGDDVS